MLLTNDQLNVAVERVLAPGARLYEECPICHGKPDPSRTPIGCKNLLCWQGQIGDRAPRYFATDLGLAMGLLKTWLDRSGNGAAKLVFTRTSLFVLLRPFGDPETQEFGTLAELPAVVCRAFLRANGEGL